MKGCKRKSACAIGIIGGSRINKKWVIISLVILVCALLLVFKPWDSKPYRDLIVNDIKSVSVEVIPPNKIVELTDAQINELIEILRTVVIYNKGTIEPLAGQHIGYTITKTDDTIIEVNPMGNLINIDGVRYNAKYEPSEHLNSFANRIINEE
ncbi:MAG: hypothetical protein RR964_09950 [Lachnospiraceae bacterium]